VLAARCLLLARCSVLARCSRCSPAAHPLHAHCSLLLLLLLLLRGRSCVGVHRDSFAP
jgi:hypothetical protein